MKHKDWFNENDEEIKLLLEEKHCLLKAHQDDTSSVSKKAAYNNICKTLQNRLLDMQNNYMEGSGTIKKVAHPKHPEEEETSPNRNHIITGKQQQTN